MLVVVKSESVVLSVRGKQMRGGLLFCHITVHTGLYVGTLVSVENPSKHEW